MDKQGWQLRCKPEIHGPFTHLDEANLPMLGYHEFRVRAVFATVPKPVRD